MTTSARDADVIRELAEAATPGPWQRVYMQEWGWVVEVPDAEIIADFGHVTNAGDDAAYIAACSPDVILALLARVHSLERALDSIILRCEEGDKTTDWLPTIASIARAVVLEGAAATPDSETGSPGAEDALSAWLSRVSQEQE